MTHQEESRLKKCTKCQREVPLSYFGRRVINSDGLNKWCKACTKSSSAEYRKTMTLEQKEKKNAFNRAYKKTDKGRSVWMDQNYKKKYGISLNDFKKMMVDHNERCAICDIHFTENGKNLCVDHCHETKKIRGLLCFNCNIGLSNFEDNIKFLNKAIEYLEK